MVGVAEDRRHASPLHHVAIVVAYVGLAFAGRELGVFGDLSVWYLPAGLALSAALLYGWAVLPVLIIGEFVTGIVVFGIAGEFTLLQMVVNAVGYASVWSAAAHVLRRRGLQPPVIQVQGLAMLLGVGVLAAPVAAAAFGVGMQVWAGMTALDTVATDVLVWWVGDAIGVVTLLPAILVFAMLAGRGPRIVPAGLRRLPPVATVVLVLAPSIVGALLFGLAPGATGVLYLVCLPMVLVALRTGTVGVALASLVLSPTVTILANQQIGALLLARTDLQVLLLGLILTGYLVALPIDEGRMLQSRLRRRQRDLDEAQALARMGSFRWEIDRDSVRWSDGLRALYGYPDDWSPGGVDAYLGAIHPAHRDRVSAVIQDVLEGGGPAEHEYPIMRTDGEQRWVVARVEAVRWPDGRVRALAGYCQDVTERREAEVARQSVAEREHAVAEQLRHTERIKDALLMAVSHEVRTPLTVVAGLADTLTRPEMGREPDMAALLAGRLRHNVTRLDRMLTDLLDTDRLARGTVEPHLEPTDLPMLVDSVLNLHDVGKRPLHVDVGVESALVDSGLLSRMLECLLVNALRYTPPGLPIWVRVRAEGPDLVMAVEDAGPGVPSARRQAIFEAFQQERRVDHSPGAGLGLYLVANFAELHGGRAWVEDRAGGGASFRVSLPGAIVPATVRAGPEPG